MSQAELRRYVTGTHRFRADLADAPAWNAIGQVERLVRVALSALGDDFMLAGPRVAVHRTAVLVAGKAVATGLVKFGAVVGDRCRIGANAVTSPGTLLPPGTVVPRLALVDQLAPDSG
jgi:acetyltransferase-like isoleucine patch superfamily enzyme